ncbi:MAG: ABC transporter ATP-binding protein [Treponema sp.]|nr:ABC transporter ATP-binding protein [Treponema sp.]
MIELNAFTKSYFQSSRKTPVFSVKDISFTVKTGTITGLLGPNGSGKTTILKTICGFQFPTSGKITVTDNDSNQFDIENTPEQAMNLIGYVPEKSILPPDLTVYEFLEHTGKIHNIENNQLKERLSFITKECSIQDVLTKKIKTLSKGYAQRVSFAQAIIHNPPNLILDEPISGLDPAQIIQMRNLIKNLSKTKAVIISTHILQEVYSLCDEMHIISKGKLVASGTEKDIITKAGTKNLEDAFLKLTESEEK